MEFTASAPSVFMPLSQKQLEALSFQVVRSSHPCEHDILVNFLKAGTNVHHLNAMRELGLKDDGLDFGGKGQRSVCDLMYAPFSSVQ